MRVTRARHVSRRTPIIGALVLLAMLLVVVGAVLVARQFADTRTRAMAQLQLEQASALTAVAVAEDVARVAATAGVIARSPFLGSALERGASESELANFAQRLHASIEGSRVTGVFAPDATTLAMHPVDRSVIGMRLDDRDWYRGVQEQSPYVSEVYELAAFDRPSSVTVVHRIENARGETLGYLSVALEASFFENVLEGASSSAGAPSLQVLDQSGAVISGQLAEGDDLWTVREDIDDLGWVLVASLSEDEVLADVRSVESAATWFVAVVGVLLLMLGIILAANVRWLAAARRQADRQEQAFELNDTIVQRLAVAHLALSIGRNDEALAQVDAALDSGRRMIGELAEGRNDYVREQAPDRKPDR
jgi:C4-dicarboxylate-specific signal transduction histidine kinase